MFGFQNVLRKEKKMLRKMILSCLVLTWKKTDIIKILYILKLFNFYIKKGKTNEMDLK